MQVNQCSVEGCGAAVLARGWCSSHYEKWRRHGDPTKGRAKPTECAEPACGRETVGQGWCSTHYARYVKAPQARERRLAAKAGRQCAQCGRPIPVSRRSRALFCSLECKVAETAASGKQREASLRAYYKRSYNLTLEQVAAMRAGGCAICGATEGGGRHGQLHIDHCHATGRVRGALCHDCNNGLGRFRDDPALLRAAAAYLME
jgi:hypothetical protein